MLCVYYEHCFHTMVALICLMRYTPSYCVGVLSTGRAYFGSASGAINMNEVQCRGTESRLLDCRYNENSECTHSEDAGVFCGVRLGELASDVWVWLCEWASLNYNYILIVIRYRII